MPATFSRTLRSLEAEGGRPWGSGLFLTALAGAWIAWFCLARVTVYEVAEQARLEVKSAAHPVALPVGGQVVESWLRLGREVQRGDVLVVFNSEAEQRAIQEKRVRCHALDARLKVLQREIEAGQELIQLERNAREVAVEEARSHVAESEARAGFAERQVEQLTALRKRNAASDEEFRRTRAEAKASRAAVQSLATAANRIGQDRLLQESERELALARLEREAAELVGEEAAERAAIARLEHEVALRTLRAPVSGRLGEVAEVHAGSVVQAAERLGSIVPGGEPRAVAWFPLAVIGRIRHGQPARLRLQAFPWTQYGTLAATVAEVGNETRGGLIRVELTVTNRLSTSAIPIEHGLSGSAEVAVEQVSPAVLVLRAAGQLKTAKPAPRQSPKEKEIAGS